MALYAEALRALGRWLGERSVLEAVADAGGSAERLAAQLAAGMAIFDDRGFYKRAQIVPADLALAGVAQLRRPRPPHDLRRQPRPARAALRRRARLRPAPGRAHRRGAPAAPRAAGARDPRLRRRTPASCSARAWACRRACSTTGCGTAARRPSTRRGRGTAAAACTTELFRGVHAPSGDRCMHRSRVGTCADRPTPPAGLRPCTGRSGVTFAGSRAGGGPAQLGDRPLELGDARRERAHRVGDGVRQVDPVGVGPLDAAAVDAHRMPGHADDRRVRRHVAR